MKIYLIGNYPAGQRSMILYINLLKKILIKNNKQVIILIPKIILNKLNFKNKLVKKWLGYIDNYIVFGFYLFFKINKNDCVHICDQANSLLYFYIRSKKLIITCHDVLQMNLRFKKNLKKLSITGKLFQTLILYVLNRYKNIICVSNKTKRELSKLINIKNRNIKVIYNALSQDFFPMNINTRQSLLKSKNIDYKYFLHVGGNSWYKNKTGLIQIFYEFNQLKKKGNYKLILAGEKLPDYLNDKIKKLKLEDSIVNLVNLNNRNICALYSGAEALIFPSIAEGFGWPIIEAQACGCPVFTSKLSPMTEVGKNTVFYLNPKDEISSSKIINEKISHKKNIIKKGFQNIKRFKLQLISQQYLSFYDKNL